MKGSKKKFIILISLSSLIIASFFIWNAMQDPLRYRKEITRNFDTPNEEKALSLAESLNYSSIVLKERFVGSTDPENYLHPGTYLSYTHANFIDATVLSYYETRYDNMQGKRSPKEIILNYGANITKMSTFRIFNSPPPQGVSWQNTTIVKTDPDGLFIRKDSAHMQMFYRNQSGYQMTDYAYDFNFSDCYVIDMELEYSEVYAPVAAFFVKVEQIVVLDSDFNPVLIGLESGMAVA